MVKQGMDNKHFWPHSPALWLESRTSGRTTWCLNPDPVGETVSTRGGGLPSSSIAGRSLEGQICRTAEWYLWIVCFKVTLVLLKSAFSFSSWWHNKVIISHWWDSRLNNMWPHMPYKQASRVWFPAWLLQISFFIDTLCGSEDQYVIPLRHIVVTEIQHHSFLISAPHGSNKKMSITHVKFMVKNECTIISTPPILMVSSINTACPLLAHDC